MFTVYSCLNTAVTVIGSSWHFRR